MWKTINIGRVYLFNVVKNMGKLNIVIEDKLDKKLRETIFKTKGMKKGNLTEAVEEAIELWIRKQTKEKK